MSYWSGFDGDTLSVAMATNVDTELTTHLSREDGQEDLCFILWRPSLGRSRSSALVVDVVLPGPGERHVHGNVSFESGYFMRSARIARDLGCGLGLIHSHPGSMGWQELSPDDVAAESGHAAQAEVLTGFPLLGMTVATPSAYYSARLWARSERRGFVPRWCESVRVVGTRFRICFNPWLRPEPELRASQVRTVSAWGVNVQSDIARIRVGVIGAGSVGSQVAEALARTGVAEITLYDFDVVEEKNLDRLLHATSEDARTKRPKVEVLRRALLRSATAARPIIRALDCSIVETEGFADALDMDVLFCCVDRPWGRQAANYLAYVHLIPVIDGGVSVDVGTTRMRGAEWRAHVATADRCCLECLGQFKPSDVSLERSGLLEDPNYLRGLSSLNTALPSGENVYAFAAAAGAAEVLQFLAMIVSPAGVEGVEPQIFHFANGKVDLDTRDCRVGCIYSGIWLGRGDSLDITVTGVDHKAEASRISTLEVRTDGSPRKLWVTVAAVLGRFQLKGRRKIE